MSLVSLINACGEEGCTKLSITDVTGAYNVTSNPTGLGTPNIDPTDSNFAVSVVVNGGTSTVLTSQVPSVITGPFTYNDITVSLPDGWNTIVYTVTSDTNTVITSIKIFSMCAIKCCIEQKMIELKTLDPCKDAGKVLTYMHIWSLYKTLKAEANGCNATEATTTLTRLQALCGVDADCGCS